MQHTEGDTSCVGDQFLLKKLLGNVARCHHRSRFGHWKGFLQDINGPGNKPVRFGGQL